jgi:hypothetical protein
MEIPSSLMVRASAQWHCAPMLTTFPFSSRTLGVLIEAIVSSNTGTTMQTLWLLAEVDEWEPTGSNKEARAQDLLHKLRYSRNPDAYQGALELARLVLVKGKPSDRGWTPSPPPGWWGELRDAVAADGWEFDPASDRLVPTVPGTVVADEVSWIEAELRRRGWTTAAEHYRQAVDSFASGNWAAANSQLRTFYESVTTTAGGTDTSSKPGQVQAAVGNLDAAGLLIAEEADFAKKLWKMLHPGGSHPGLSDEDESRFRLLALTGYVRFLLSRLPQG